MLGSRGHLLSGRFGLGLQLGSRNEEPRRIGMTSGRQASSPVSV
jgi:hypothetical protein